MYQVCLAETIHGKAATLYAESTTEIPAWNKYRLPDFVSVNQATSGVLFDELRWPHFIHDKIIYINREI